MTWFAPFTIAFAHDCPAPTTAAALAAQVLSEGPILSRIFDFLDVNTLSSLINVSAELREAVIDRFDHLFYEVGEPINVAISEDNLHFAASNGLAYAFEKIFIAYFGQLEPPCMMHDPLVIMTLAIESMSPVTAIVALNCALLVFQMFPPFEEPMKTAMSIAAAKTGSKPITKLVVAKLGFQETAALIMADFNPNLHPLLSAALFEISFKDNVAPFDLYMECISATDRQKFLMVPFDFIEPPLLPRAARQRRSALVEVMMRHGCPHDLKDHSSWMALHWAAHHRDKDMAAALLAVNANPNAVTSTGKTPLHLAAVENSLECIDVLLRRGADPYAVCRDDDDARMAMRFEQLPLAMVYIPNEQAFANTFGFAELPWLSTELGLRPIEMAAVAGHVDAVRRLGEAMVANGRGPVFPDRRWDALKYTVVRGRLDVLDALLDLGADVDACDNDGARPLHWAVGAGNLSMVMALLAAGADPGCRDAQGRTPGDVVGEVFEGEEERAAVRRLLEVGGKEG